jgi:penicillin amidase
MERALRSEMILQKFFIQLNDSFYFNRLKNIHFELPFMQLIRFLLIAGIFSAVTYFFGSGYGKLPAPGKFFNPNSGFWQNLSLDTTLPVNDMKMEDLIGKVVVSYDEHLIPHIFAENESDLWLVQGYIHASHRLWQMDFQTRAILGRLSEVLGPNFVTYDRERRRKGLVHAAETSLEGELKDPEVQLALLQYSKGVNAYISGLKKHEYPLEFKLLDYSPEAWTPLKSMLLLTFMSDMLTTSEYDLENTLFVNTFGIASFEALFPDICKKTDPIVDKAGKWPAAETPADSITDLIPDWNSKLPSLQTGSGGLGEGSNNWVVGPSKTADSSIILCNDPHLRLQFPSLWFINQIHSGRVAAKGVSLPGLPGVVLGFNDSVSWGVTNAQRDVVDWYQITFKDASNSKYLLDGQWQSSRKVVERIEVKGGGPVFDTVVYTRFGPVVYDQYFGDNKNKEGFAYKWISHEETRELAGFLMINRAQNISDIHAATKLFKSTGQNMVMADVHGQYGITITGAYPLRIPGEGRFIRDGRHSINDWRGFIPESHRPEVFNPSSGFVSSANQHPVDSTYPYYIYGVPHESYRNERINEVLREGQNFDISDMKRLQVDNLNLKGRYFATWVLPRFDSLNYSASARDFLKILQSWDYENAVESAGATAFQVFWDTLYANCWAAINYYGQQLRKPTTFHTLVMMRDQPNSPFFDNPRTELVEHLDHHLIAALESAAATYQTLDNTRWYQFKNTGIRHILSIPEFSRFEVPVGGFSGIVNANTGTHGASWRLVTKLDKTGVTAYGIIPGGQSGHVGSPYYDSFVDDWAKGAYLELKFFSVPFGKHLLIFDSATP